MKPVESSVCIYCRSAENPISREHVIPEAFGTFGGQTLVLHCVCKECNGLFSKEFEQAVYRGSLDGIRRWQYGLKPLETRDKIDSRRVKLNAKGGKFDGLRLDPVTNDVEPQLEVRRKDSEEKVQLTLPEISRLTDSEAAGLDFVKSKLVVWNQEQKVRFSEALRRFGFGIDENFVGEKIEHPAQMRLSGTLTVTMDVKTARAMAKISFNYLTRVFGAEYALSSHFDPIRSFILKGELPEMVRVVPSGVQESVKRERPEQPLHFLTLNLQRPGVIYGRVVLFSGHTYHVALAVGVPDESVPEALRIGFGHVFDMRRGAVMGLPQEVLIDWNRVKGSGDAAG